MMEELSKKELAEAKRQARRLRISNIRRRVATGAVMLVALFTGLVLYRSLEQQQQQLANTSTTATASVTRSDEGTSIQGAIGAAIVDQAVSAFADDDDDGEDDGGSITSVFSGSSPAPMTSSQS